MIYQPLFCGWWIVYLAILTEKRMDIMKKQNTMKLNKYTWELYKQSEKWKEASALFDPENLAENEYSYRENKK